MDGDLFHDLPPPSAPQSQQIAHSPTNGALKSNPKPPPPPTLPAPALKSALKRPKPQPEENAFAPGKRLRFKTTTDASEKQVIEAMQKIASHIKNPSKFNKASKLAIHDDYHALFSADYHALFSAAQGVVDCLTKKQQNLLAAWTIRAVWANDLFTDDSFVIISHSGLACVCWSGGDIAITASSCPISPDPVLPLRLPRWQCRFSKATGRIKEAISALPVATKEDDMEEAAAFKDETEEMNADAQLRNGGHVEEEPDPFGLDALISNTPAKEEKLNGKKEPSSNNRK
ncbi:hypothetical protein SASPL_108321 [Salvia splendens]|uniref:Uncharacterized protein n=1 Tax=Salvia splendens TaxID=180675 RepID=A0A8X9A6J4_SALSN|nr:hypothetical protein SASPL_108321 [Salvia splendens]